MIHSDVEIIERYNENLRKLFADGISEYIIKNIINPALIKEGIDPENAGIKLEIK